MEGKKISFGFMKTKKAEKLMVEEKKDFIECMEEKSIKVIGGEEVKENAPLVIPMKPNTLVTSERLKEIAVKVESAIEEPETTETPQENAKLPENETLEQMAVRELLEDSKKAVKVENPQLMLTLPAKSLSSGEKESTLDDYESVPVQEFGLAMLRGMGWTQGKEASKFKQPQLRPKGLGLGADKVVKDNQKQKAAKNSKDENLTIVKNAYVKITTGKYSGYYGKVLSLDEDNGRVMVEIPVKKDTVSLSEFMMHPVTKAEFDKESKVLNANSFEEYKKKDVQRSEHESSRDSERNREGNKHVREGNSSKGNRREYERESDSSKSRERNRDRSNREKRDDSDEKYKNKKYSSNESLSSSSDSEKKKKEKYRSIERNKERTSKRHDDSDSHRKSKKIEKEHRRHYSSDSESDHRRRKRSVTPQEKRDIDKKRKGKKKKRDRDRSPNYRKHRK